MSFIEILLIAFGVSVDAFSVAVGGSFCDRTGKVLRNALRAALYFGGFQFLMPLAGFLASGMIAGFVSSYGRWIGFLLLLFVGGKMMFDGIQKFRHPDEIECTVYDFFGWKALLIPAVATSIDAFAIGAGLAFAGVSPWIPCAAMGIVTAIISLCGVFSGHRLARLAQSSQTCRKFLPEWLLLFLAGLAIALIGVRILLF